MSEGGIGGEEESRLDRMKPQVDGREWCRVGGTSEEVIGSVRERVAVWASVCGGSANSIQECLKKLAEAGTELCKDAAPVAREASLRSMDGWRADAQHPVDAVCLDLVVDRARVDCSDGRFVICFGHDSIVEVV